MLCNKCGLDKPTDLFSKNRRDTRGYTYQCKACESAKHKEYYQRTKKDRLAYRRSYLYGVDDETYDKMKESCGNLCEICGGKCPSGRRLAVDHCHTTDKVRGLLCTNCNTALGSFKDDKALLHKAIQYLERTSDVSIL